MRGWKLIGAGAVLFWGWVFVASAIWPGDTQPWAAYVPLVVGAVVTTAVPVVALRDPDRRFERLPLALTTIAGGLALVGTIWGIAAPDSHAYAIPLAFSMLAWPAVAVTAFTTRRFQRKPERVRPPTGVRLRRGWTEATKSWSVLGENRGLFVLPLTSFTLGTAGWLAAFAVAGHWADRWMPRLALTGFIVLLPLTMLGTFLGAAFVAALNQRLDGKPATARDGLRIAWRHRGPIFRWSLLAAGVGAILQGLQQLKSEWAIAPLLSWLTGVAWGVLTLFVLPVLAIEGIDVRDAARRAGRLVGAKWGEGIAGLANLSIVGVVLSLPLSLAAGVAVAIAAPDRDAMTAVLVVSFVAFMLVMSTVSAAGQVLAVALYRHAAGRSTGPFTATELDDALRRRRKLL